MAHIMYYDFLTLIVTNPTQKCTSIDLSDDEDEVEAEWMVDVSGKHEDDLMGDKDTEYDQMITYQSL
ncbi:hypothetical protein CROQUDRAFT_99617 [Cronartium quercuum f. sp. fusiforme G11]|uniref:Uncharacterized protein n=1 Tax=Cronartium quercuum f. sp. fusiforme G11 TaxID=708437 RepID=A0A9P6T6F8_9BASI|nr:hypothetical protein CROQUDRAFT_99617 [Cronartium quercuum f. sp. fusiforme G11]